MTFREPRKGRISAPARGACDSETVTSGNRESNPNGSSTATRETNRNRSVTTFQREGSEGEEVCASIEKTNHEARGLRPSRPARGQPALCAPKPLLRQNPAGVRKIRRGERSFAWWFAFRQETHTFPNPASLHFWKTVTPCLLLVCSPTPYVVFERGRGTSRGGHNPSFCGGKNTVATNRLPVGRSLGRIGAWRRNYPFLDGGTCSRGYGNPSLRSGIAAWYSPWSWRLFAPHGYPMGNRPAPCCSHTENTPI